MYSLLLRYEMVAALVSVALFAAASFIGRRPSTEAWARAVQAFAAACVAGLVFLMLRHLPALYAIRRLLLYGSVVAAAVAVVFMCRMVKECLRLGGIRARSDG